MTKKIMLRIDVLTLFPKMFEGPLNESMIRLAQKKKLVEIHVHNLRKWTRDKHKTCDDKPFGGGPGMVMKIEPIFSGLREIQKKTRSKGCVVAFSPRGQVFNQALAQKFLKKKHLILICGHYEGIDERVHDKLVDEEISLGDFVVTGGELPAMCLIDAVTRLVPGVLGNEQSLDSESFQSGLLEYPQYTRPSEFNGWRVPDILRSGVHKEIAAWRQKEAMRVTKKWRPDLLKK